MHQFISIERAGIYIMDLLLLHTSFFYTVKKCATNIYLQLMFLFNFPCHFLYDKFWKCVLILSF